MFTFLVILIALIGLLLVLVVLVQSGKGGGLAGIAAGGATTQILGARQAPDVLEKATWTLATAFIVLCILTNFAIDRDEQEGSVIQERAQQGQTQQAPVLPPAGAPGTAPSTPNAEQAAPGTGGAAEPSGNGAGTTPEGQ